MVCVSDAIINAVFCVCSRGVRQGRAEQLARGSRDETSSRPVLRPMHRLRSFARHINICHWSDALRRTFIALIDLDRRGTSGRAWLTSAFVAEVGRKLAHSPIFADKCLMTLSTPRTTLFCLVTRKTCCLSAKGKHSRRASLAHCQLVAANLSSIDWLVFVTSSGILPRPAHAGQRP